MVFLLLVFYRSARHANRVHAHEDVWHHTFWCSCHTLLDNFCLYYTTFCPHSTLYYTTSACTTHAFLHSHNTFCTHSTLYYTTYCTHCTLYYTTHCTHSTLYYTTYIALTFVAVASHVNRVGGYEDVVLDCLRLCHNVLHPCVVNRGINVVLHHCVVHRGISVVLHPCVVNRGINEALHPCVVNRGISVALHPCVVNREISVVIRGISAVQLVNRGISVVLIPV